MRALHVPAAGEQPTLSELPTPQVADGQVLIKVMAAGLNAIDNAMQLLASRGVTVVATGTAQDTDRLTGLGAATVIDHTQGPVAEQVLAAYPDGVDALIELAAYTPDAAPLAAVRKGGKVSATTQ